MLQNILCGVFMDLAMLAFQEDDRQKVYAKATEKFFKIESQLGKKNFLTGAKVTMVDFICWEHLDTVIAIAESD